MKSYNLTETEYDTIRVALSEFWDNEHEWIETCMKEGDTKATIHAAINIRNTEHMLKEIFVKSK